MTIADELAELGHLGGPATMTMVTARWRSATNQFYVLEPAGGWNDENRLDLLHDFLCERLEPLTDALIVVGDDEVALLKLTSRIMKNWLTDQARKTDTGAIRLRLEELLKADPSFRRLPGHTQRWALSGMARAEFSRHDDESLFAAAMAVPNVKPVRWRDESRRAPMASGADLTRVLTAVLGCAGSAGLEIGMLSRVFQRRFAVTVTSHVPLDADDTLADRLAAPLPTDPAQAAEASTRAAEVYAQLSDRERRILIHLDDRPRVEEILNVGRSVAYMHIARVRMTLAALAGEDLDVEAVAAELLRLAESDAAPDEMQDATSGRSATINAEGAQRP